MVLWALEMRSTSAHACQGAHCQLICKHPSTGSVLVVPKDASYATFMTTLCVVYDNVTRRGNHFLVGDPNNDTCRASLVSAKERVPSCSWPFQVSTSLSTVILNVITSTVSLLQGKHLLQSHPILPEYTTARTNEKNGIYPTGVDHHTRAARLDCIAKVTIP